MISRFFCNKIHNSLRVRCTAILTCYNNYPFKSVFQNLASKTIINQKFCQSSNHQSSSNHPYNHTASKTIEPVCYQQSNHPQSIPKSQFSSRVFLLDI